MESTADSDRVIAALSTHYTGHWNSGGDAVWVQHAWRSLAEAGHVPASIASSGVKAAGHKFELAALAHLSLLFNEVDAGPSPEYPHVFDGPFAVTRSEVVVWMEREGIEPPPTPEDLDEDEYDWFEDHEERLWVLLNGVDNAGARIEPLLTQIMTVSELFAQLWAARYATRGQILGDQIDDPDAPDGSDAPLAYPLTGAELDELLNHAPFEAGMPFEWLEQRMAVSSRRA